MKRALFIPFPTLKIESLQTLERYENEPILIANQQGNGQCWTGIAPFA